MSSEEVCRILRTCAAVGVTELKLGALSVTLGTPPRSGAGVSPRENTESATPATEIAEPNHLLQSRESLTQREVDLREDQIAELLLTDPIEAERMISEGELEEDGDTRDGED